MNKDAAYPPFRFRFTEERDVQKYGKEWFTYSELDLITAPAKVLLPIEEELGVPLTTIMDGFRQSSVLGDTGAAWLALWMAGQKVPWDGFNPCSMLMEWEQVTEGTGKASADTSIGTGSADTVALPTLPVGG